jgi:predicted RNA-binding protein with PIN domain|tara:strand:+ start:25 stop:492 length:468 start_codon:yes stop_codon:yes gene_type:complete
MLVYIIDGFNLIHKVPALKSALTPQRALIDYIRRRRLTGSKNNRVIIVFDGNMVSDIKRKESGFEVFFSGQGSADEIIKSKVSATKGKSEIIVVTDDRQIRDFILREGARALHVREFLKSKTKKKEDHHTKDISYSLQQEITEELRKTWLSEHCE